MKSEINVYQAELNVHQAELNVYQKAWMVFLLTAWALSIMAPSLVCAQDGKTATQSQKAQGAVAADSDQYIIGAEDVLLIYVWREESITRTVPVRIDGMISLPLVNDIQAAGLTPLQLKEALTAKLQDFVGNPTVTVTVMEANSYKVYVSGEVKNPGVQRIRSEVTLLKLISTVGGFTEWANKKKILIIRKEKGADKRITANYNKIVDGGEPDIVITRGDTIIVP